MKQLNQSVKNVEEKVLSYWREDKTFAKSIKGDSDFVFYDGPPFANGLPHYGHLLTGCIKDLIARFQTMLGKKVERRFGWDCHGLPAEMAAEKDLGISGKIAIENYGIEKFNSYCKSAVLKYTTEWQDYVNRQARWVDFDNDYKTMDLSYMESVIWAFKQLYTKGLLYESHRVLPYSWACETPVSDFETKMDNSYREKKSKAATVKLKIISGGPKLEYPTYLLIWTTTPWTLPSNLAAAVNSEIEYALVLRNQEYLIIAKEAVPKYEAEIGNEIVATVRGADLIGAIYEPLFSYFAGHENAFRVLHGDFVTTEDGTGIVHIAPGFGEDDQALCAGNNIELVCPVDSAGKFTHPVTQYIGMQVFEANDPILKALKEKGLIVKIEQYIHNYPHCWRTDTPLIYKAMPSWYVKVTNFKDRMIEHNKEINWIPGHIQDGIFGKWLAGARDWSISRNRYWGCPIPVWKSDDPAYPHIEVYGSIKEIEDAFGVKVQDLHRPFIDELVKPNPSDPTGQSMLRRVSDVLDCWFESGSMPFAQLHYPFENREAFERNFPADFIVEYVAQTRGWFYTLMVLSTALFDKPPFLNCICHGVILGDSGQKMSKRLKNYPDPNEMFDTLGADALRWFMVSSGVMRGHELIIDKDGQCIKDSVKLAIKPFMNAYNFFALYASVDKIEAKIAWDSNNTLDQYILAKLHNLISSIKSSLIAYDTVTACKATEDFLEILTNWYIRRSRERFWKAEHDQDKASAYNTLYTVLLFLCKALAPLMPLITEEIYQNLTQSNESVHLQSFPDVSIFSIPNAPKVISDMERVRDACTAALSLRNNAGIRVRQPLSKVTFIGVANDISEDLRRLILDEINVKEWVNLPKDMISDFAKFKVQINFQIVGKRIPHAIKAIIEAQKLGEWSIDNGRLKIASEVLEAQEFSMLLEPKLEFRDVLASLPSNDALVRIDTIISPELELEGIARDIVRAIQQTRKDMDLAITDKIAVSITDCNDKIQLSIDVWSEYIMSQTLASSIVIGKLDKCDSMKEVLLDDLKFTLYIARA